MPDWAFATILWYTAATVFGIIATCMWTVDLPRQNMVRTKSTSDVAMSNLEIEMMQEQEQDEETDGRC